MINRTLSLSFLSAILTSNLAFSNDWKPLFTDANGKLSYKQLLIKDNGVERAATKNIVSVTKDTLTIYPNWTEKAAPFALIYAPTSHKNYQLKFEYKWGENRFSPKQNAKKGSGLLFHIHDLENRKHWPNCMELQVQDGDVADLWVLNSYATPLTKDNTPISFKDPERFGNRAPKYALHEKPGWNTVLLKVTNNSAEFYVNGKLVNQIKDMKIKGPAKSPLTSGLIGFQAEGAQISYRNIQIKSN